MEGSQRWDHMAGTLALAVAGQMFREQKERRTSRRMNYGDVVAVVDLTAVA